MFYSFPLSSCYIHLLLLVIFLLTLVGGVDEDYGAGALVARVRKGVLDEAGLAHTKEAPDEGHGEALPLEQSSVGHWLGLCTRRAAARRGSVRIHPSSLSPPSSKRSKFEAEKTKEVITKEEMEKRKRKR